MEENEEEYSLSSFNFDEINHNREINVILSEIDDRIHIHSSCNLNDCEEESEGSKYSNKDDQTCTDFIIIDITKLIKNKDANAIREFALQSISSGFQCNLDNQIEKVNDIEELKNESDSELLRSDQTHGLFDRSKNQKLSIIQLKYLKSEINKSELSSKKLSKQYNVSTSIINKIKRTDLNLLWRSRSTKLVKVFGTEKKVLINELQLFLNETNHAFNSSEITNHINSKLRKSYKTSFIRTVMKHDLKLSFKKVKPRPNTVKFDILNASRQLFAVKFSQLINHNTLVINIDETSFNRHIKNSYSWSRKGVPTEAKNSPFTGSINCLMAILSSGQWLLLLTNKTSNSEKFVLFLNKLNSWISANEGFGYKDILITLDNWSIHKSKEVTQILKELNFNVIYLPAYTPQFAPIEMWFSKVKGNLRQIWATKIVSLTLKLSYNYLFDALKKIKSEYIKSLFKEMYSVINKYL